MRVEHPKTFAAGATRCDVCTQPLWSEACVLCIGLCEVNNWRVFVDEQLPAAHSLQTKHRVEILSYAGGMSNGSRWCPASPASLLAVRMTVHSQLPAAGGSGMSMHHEMPLNCSGSMSFCKS